MRMWELRRNNVASDPIAEDELEAMLEAGTVEGSVAVRPVGKEAWKPAFRHAPFAAAASRAPHRVGATLQSAKPPAALPPPKDPQRWDQQTQLHMPAQPLPAAMASAPPPLPTSANPTPPPPPPEGSRPPHTPVVTVTGPPAAPAPVVSATSLPTSSAQAPRTAPSPGRAPSPGFLAALLDPSFTTFLAPRVAKAFYVVFMLAVVVAMLGGLIAGVVTLSSSGAAQSDAGRILGLLQLVATPVAALILLVVGRMAFESIIVFFRVAEHLAEIDRKTPG